MVAQEALFNREVGWKLDFAETLGQLSFTLSLHMVSPVQQPDLGHGGGRVPRMQKQNLPGPPKSWVQNHLSIISATFDCFKQSTGPAGTEEQETLGHE